MMRGAWSLPAGLLVCLFAASAVAADVAESAACERVARAATDGGLSQLRSTASEADLNGDDRTDSVEIRSAGTAHIASATIRVAGQSGEPVKVSGYAHGEFDLRLVNVDGLHFLLSSSGEVPGHLWRLTAEGEPRRVCAFSSEPEEEYELVGEPSPFCSAVRPAALERVGFPLMHALDAGAGARLPRRRPIPGLAKEDLDGDGNVDNIVRIDNTHGGGRGCGSTYLALVNESRTALLPGRLNEFLLGEYCGPTQVLVRIDRRAYVLFEVSEDEYSLDQLSPEGGEVRCRFERKRSYRSVAPE